MRWVLLIAAAALGLTACSSSPGHNQVAEVLGVDVPAEVVGGFHPPPVKACDVEGDVAKGCMFRYRIRVRNETDRRFWVSTCLLTGVDVQGQELFSAKVSIGFPAGVLLDPGRERIGAGMELFQLSQRRAARIDHLAVSSCEAWDWHDYAPI
jgi:hypothetical protein